MANKVTIEALPQVTYIKEGDEVGQIIVDAAEATGFQFQEHDILCIASKAVSIAEGRVRALKSVQVSEAARRIHQQVPRKDERVIQVIIDETGMPDGSQVEVSDNYIGGWLPNGLRLTSAGVDKKDTEHVYLLPANPDASARAISKKILAATNVHVGVIITDSDGRIEKAGATQVAIGAYGVPPLRKTESIGQDGSVKTSEETICDMMAAAAGLIMGQRGNNKPIVVLRGYDFEFDETSGIRQALSRPSVGTHVDVVSRCI